MVLAFLIMAFAMLDAASFTIYKTEAINRALKEHVDAFAYWQADEAHWASKNRDDDSDTTASDLPPLSNLSDAESEEFLPDINGADKLVKDHEVIKNSQEECQKFYDERNDKDGNFFGTTIIVDLQPDTCDASNKELSRNIRDFQNKLREIEGSEKFFDFQQNPHMTVSAVIMDRAVKKEDENKKFEKKTTEVSKIKNVIREIEDRNVTVKVLPAEALKIANNKGQFSMQFDGANQEATNPSNLDFEEAEKQIMNALLTRFRNETDATNLKNLGERAGKAIAELEKFKLGKQAPTEFQTVRFELMEKIGADTKDHYPAMALHIGQIKDPEALNENAEALKEVNKIFTEYKGIFQTQTNKIAMKGLKYVEYRSTSLNPDMIQYR